MLLRPARLLAAAYASGEHAAALPALQFLAEAGSEDVQLQKLRLQLAGSP